MSFKVVLIDHEEIVSETVMEQILNKGDSITVNGAFFEVRGRAYDLDSNTWYLYGSKTCDDYEWPKTAVQV